MIPGALFTTESDAERGQLGVRARAGEVRLFERSTGSAPEAHLCIVGNMREKLVTQPKKSVRAMAATSVQARCASPLCGQGNRLRGALVGGAVSDCLNAVSKQVESWKKHVVYETKPDCTPG